MKAAIRRRRVAAIAMASLVTAGAPLVLALTPAQAFSASCSAWKTTIPRTGWDDNYATATCTSIGATTKVRAKLDVTADSDAHSVWFTTTYRTYSTPTTNCVWGCSATYELASR